MPEMKWFDRDTGEELPPPPRKKLRPAPASLGWTSATSFSSELSKFAKRWVKEHPEAVTIDDPSRLRCDYCGEEAYAVQWWPFPADDEQVECVLACREHDAGYAYHFPIESILAINEEHSRIEHLIDTKGFESVLLWIRRLDEAKEDPNEDF